MRFLHAVMALVFCSFVAVQFNDVDVWIWVTAYGAVAALSGLAAWGRPLRRAASAATLIYTAWAVVLFLQTTGQWWDGEIEREVGGLTIAAVWSLVIAATRGTDRT